MLIAEDDKFVKKNKKSDFLNLFNFFDKHFLGLRLVLIWKQLIETHEKLK